MLVLLGETRPTSIVDCTPDRVSGPGERPTKRHWTSAMLSRPVLGIDQSNSAVLMSRLSDCHTFCDRRRTVGRNVKRGVEKLTYARLPGPRRNPMAIRFQAFIVAMRRVRSTRSLSLKCSRTKSYASSGACVVDTLVSDSAHSKAARSRSE